MADEKKKRPANKGSFGPNDPRLKQNLAKADPTPPRVLPPADEPLVDTMRHVFRTPPGSDATHGQAVCRAWLKEDPKGFMARLADLEKAAGKAPSDEPSEERLADEASDRVEGLIGELLDTAKRRTLQGRHDALAKALKDLVRALRAEYSKPAGDGSYCDGWAEVKAADEAIALSESVT